MGPSLAVRRALLVNPHWSTLRRQGQSQYRRAWPPLDLALAAQMLEDDGVDVTVVDNNVERRNPEELGRMAGAHDLTFVTSSPYDRWQCPALDITHFYETIAEMPRDRLVVMGAHVSERLQATLTASGAAAAIVHEPEPVIREVCRQGLQAGLPGLAMLQDGQVHQGPPAPLLDLESAPFPAFHRLPMDRYYYEIMGDRFALLESSRGCPYRCTFCYLGMYGTKFRQKSVERFFEEVRWAVEVQGRRNLYFMDLEFALNRRFVVGLCDAILRHGLRFAWCCQTRVTDVDDELVALMRRAGCRVIHFGVESGSDRVLKQTGKKITTSDAITAIETTKRHGVDSVVFMNVGFPGETADEMRETRDFARRLDPTFASFHIVMPFPGTPLGQAFDSERLPAHRYADSVATTTAELKALKRQLRRCYASFYLRPKPLVRLARRAGVGHLWHQARTFADLILH